jgi:hypothetical protein
VASKFLKKKFDRFAAISTALGASPQTPNNQTSKHPKEVKKSRFKG